MTQIVDLENSTTFNDLDIQLISIAADPVDVLRSAAAEYGVATPLLSDGDKAVSNRYGVMKWATKGGEPSHTFVLIGKDGKIAWVQDYGAAENGGRMYVPLEELLPEIERALK